MNSEPKVVYTCAKVYKYVYPQQCNDVPQNIMCMMVVLLASK